MKSIITKKQVKEAIQDFHIAVSNFAIKETSFQKNRFNLLNDIGELQHNRLDEIKNNLIYGFDYKFKGIPSELDNSLFFINSNDYYQIYFTAKELTRRIKDGIFVPYNYNNTKDEWDVIIPTFVNIKYKNYKKIPFINKLREKQRLIFDGSNKRNGTISINGGVRWIDAMIKYHGRVNYLIDVFNELEDLCENMDIEYDPHCFTADLKSGYEQLWISKQRNIKIGIYFNGVILEPNVALWGLSEASRWMQDITTSVCHAIGFSCKNDIKLSIEFSLFGNIWLRLFHSYVDDFIVLALNKLLSERLRVKFKEHCDNYGLTLNDDKFSNCERKIIWVGNLFIPKERKINLTLEKKNKTVCKCILIIYNQGGTVREWESVIGLMMSGACIRWPLKAIVMKLYEYIKEFDLNNCDLFIPIKYEQCKIMTLFCNILLRCEPLDWNQLIECPLYRQPIFKTFESDACDSGCGGICLENGEWFYYCYSDFEKRYHINIKEAHAARVLPLYYENDLSNKNFRMVIDNKPVFNGYKEKRFNNTNVLDSIALLCGNCALKQSAYNAYWVKREDNILADKLSKGKFKEARIEAKKRGIIMKDKPLFCFYDNKFLNNIPLNLI